LYVGAQSGPIVLKLGYSVVMRVGHMAAPASLQNKAIGASIRKVQGGRSTSGQSSLRQTTYESVQRLGLEIPQ
jgi:hypothetical protein